jgi:DNA repair protein RecO (recombination protein O)
MSAVPQETSEAVVIRGVDFSETSRVVTLLTPHRGRMAVLARGVRRKNSPLAAALDTFNRVEVVYAWKDGRGVQTLVEASPLDDFAGLKRNLARGAFAAFPLELAYKVAHENEPSGPLFEALVAGLHALARPGQAPLPAAAWTVLRMLRVAGFGPTLDACVRCGGPVADAAGFAWDGGVACARCGSDQALGGGVLRALRGMAAAPTPGAPDSADGAVFGLLRRYAAHQLETGFRSLRVLDQLVGRNEFPTGGGPGPRAPQDGDTIS